MTFDVATLKLLFILLVLLCTIAGALYFLPRRKDGER